MRHLRLLDASTPLELDEVLSGSRGVEPVRQVVSHPWAHGLGAALAEEPRAPDPGRVEIVRSKFKPGRKLSALYRMDTAGAPVLVAATWLAADGAGAPRVSALVFPADRTMPQLARLRDPHHLAGAVDSLTGRDDLRSQELHVDTIRYRPGERHVLVATVRPASGGVVVKTDRERSGERAVPVARAVDALLRSRCPEVRTADALGWLPSDAASVWLLAPGPRLSQALVQRTRDSTSEVALLGRAVRLLHDDTATVGRLRASGCTLPSRDVAGELAATERAAHHIRVLLPDVWPAVDATLAASAAALARSPRSVAVVHGDLKSDNVLLGNPLRILDWDRAGLGDPATDLAKFVADLHWWCPGGADGLLDAFRRGYGDGVEERWSRAEALVPVFRLRLLARRCAVHEPDWSARVESLVAAAARTTTGSR